ncbi:CUPIN, Germin, oxalate decarboxylase [Heterobasidion irregulare TC 32-1]|uniref:CUPIN, Germin, oxalate decarboxylase n=1 Tax=Heterobasidion irregulare (strain TC 32-1) TaxID=747525 RepID=W4KCN0_HETIT|nr:CUPIN, Germin, oxalate decarboxylase [Heterobasidion irregulare TC 32-1]ETW82806.1 CUPIN, Germin, oxalate decarboxylase [Heterobasidion irregulare TC 32-1]
MHRFANSLLCAVLLAISVSAAPASNPSAATSSTALASPVSVSNSTDSTASVSGPPSATSDASAASPSPTVPFASDDPNTVIFSPGADVQPEAQRGTLGSTVIGPQNVQIDRQNPDFLAPPTTDNGDVSNAKWPFGLSHNRIQTGGWARQQNIENMPIATQMAGVDMRLEPGAVRELHWHKTSEWSYVIKGSTQVTAVDQDGKNYLATVNAGDLWYFPPGIPHSLQATNDSAEGTEFLLVFDDGAFSEDATFLLTDWLAHVPKEVIAKNFQTDISAFDDIPGRELYIFPAAVPSSDATAVSDPQGQVPNAFSFAMSKINATQLSGGTVKIVDSTTFPISTTIAAADVTVEPGAMRELHWHPTQDEWTYFIEGDARMTIFASQSNARTFDYQAGDIGYVPASFGHYVENIGNTTLHYLEIFKTDRFQDVSLSQWLALTPPELVKAHLGLSDATIATLKKTKQTVVGPS